MFQPAPHCAAAVRLFLGALGLHRSQGECLTEAIGSQLSLHCTKWSLHRHLYPGISRHRAQAGFQYQPGFAVGLFIIGKAF